MNLDLTKIQLDCFGESNGKVQITPNGGVFPYTLMLDGDVITTGLKVNENYTINNLSAGNYKLQLIDSNGCLSDENVFEVTQPTLNFPFEILQ